jgi:hypothetical protein
MTALMVKLGWLNLVRDIVVSLSRQDRSDVVSKVGPLARDHAPTHETQATP